MDLTQAISDWIKQQVKDNNKRGVVVGLSGGIDSSLAAVLAKKALGDNALGLILPCDSNGLDEELANSLASEFDIKTKKVNLGSLYKQISDVNPDASRIAKANLKARLRMMTLYYFANSLDYLVVGTGNKSEIAIGYFTKHGDGGCDILPLAELFKTEVRSLAQQLNIPSEIINRPPTAGLWPDQTDEKEIGMSYDDLDQIIKAIEDDKLDGVDKRKLKRVQVMIKYSDHKRRTVPVFTRQ